MHNPQQTYWFTQSNIVGTFSHALSHATLLKIAHHYNNIEYLKMTGCSRAALHEIYCPARRYS